MTNLPLRQIVVKGGTQTRDRLNTDAVNEYADLMQAGTIFPPVVVFYDGDSYWLADGFHRYAAAVVLRTIEGSIDAEVKQGTQREAILYSCGANAHHGLRRTNADKRRAVQRLLDDPEWSTWSNRAIADACEVSKTFVSALRAEPAQVATVATCLETSKSASANNQRLGADGKTYPAVRLNTEPPSLSSPPITQSLEDFTEDSGEVSYGLEGEGYVIRTAWDSIYLTPAQALDLYGDLAANNHRLRRLLNKAVAA